MVVEWLSFRVAPERQEHFLRADDRIWSQALKRYPGLVSKQVWRDPEQPDLLVMIIHWSDRRLWKSIPLEELARLDREFQQALGFPCPIVEAREFEVAG
jgi:uncharacterized protein (TIGR03792 family)